MQQCMFTALVHALSSFCARSPHAATSRHRYESNKIEDQIKNSSLYKLKVSHSHPHVLAVNQRCPSPRLHCPASAALLAALRFAPNKPCSLVATSNDSLFFQAFREKRASLSDFDRFKVPLPSPLPRPPSSSLNSFDRCRRPVSHAPVLSAAA